MPKITRILSAFLPHSTTAVILAAGNGTRMNSDIKKQFIDLFGKTVLERSIEAFENASSIDSIIVVTGKESIDHVKELIKANQYKKVISVVKGGETRFQSAFAGMMVCPEKTTHIAIHDAARCLITPEQIDKVAYSAYKNGSAFASMPTKDTIKLLDAHGRTVTGEKQLRRSSLVAASTPQIFKFTLYCAAAYTAKKDMFEPTDDCSLIEHIGFTCHPVDCGSDNIKITNPQDIATAEFILRSRENNL